MTHLKVSGSVDRMKNMKHLIASLAFIMLMPALAIAQAPPGTRETTPEEELIYRVTLGKAKDVKLMLDKVGNPNLVDNMGWPILAIASARTDAEALPVVKLLVENGADVNFHGGTLNYPIMFAVQSGNEDIVEYLLGKGANYRATDGYGMRLVDFARQSGDQEVIKLIEDAVDKDIMNLARVRSQEYLDESVHNLAYHSCAIQYYSFYYKSGQDPVPLALQNTTLETHKKAVGKALGDLVQLFRLPNEWASDIFVEARNLMAAELENLVSNRWRRIKGVGKEGDMEERCGRLTEKWKEGIFDKEELDNRI